MKPEDLAKPNTEHSHQVALFCWAAQNLVRWPELRWMYAIPNGGNRDPVTAGRLKAEGVKSGVSDICLPVARKGYHGFFLELKKPGGKASTPQLEFGAFLATQNYCFGVFDTWEKAKTAIEWYME